MKLRDMDIDFQPLNGERYAVFCEQASALEAVEMTHKVLEQQGFEPYDEHFYMDVRADSLRKSLETMMLRGAGRIALVVIPGLSSWIVAGREKVDEVQLLAYLFQMGKQVAGVRVPVVVPIHTAGLDIDRDQLKEALKVSGFQCVSVGFEDIDVENRKPPLWDEEVEATVRMSGIAQIAEGIANQPRASLPEGQLEGRAAEDNREGKDPGYEVR